MIQWGVQMDRHIEGITKKGKVCIRLNKKNEVTSMYTMFGSTNKYTPEEQGVSSIADAKFVLEELLRSKN